MGKKTREKRWQGEYDLRNSFFEVKWLDERMKRICPFVNGKCIKTKCMFYAAELIDKKEIDPNRCIILLKLMEV